MNLRTPLARARGLGSAKDGTHHWIAQRLTAVALVPLSLWIMASLLAVIEGADYATAIAWIRSPAVTILLILLVVAVFYHGRLGLQVVIEDYVHTGWTKVTLLLGVDFVAAGLALAAIIAVLRIAFGG